MKNTLKIFVFLLTFSPVFLRAADDTNFVKAPSSQSKKLKSPGSTKHHVKKKKGKGKKSKDDTNLNAQEEVSDQTEVSQQADSKNKKRK